MVKTMLTTVRINGVISGCGLTLPTKVRRPGYNRSRPSMEDLSGDIVKYFKEYIRITKWRSWMNIKVPT